MLSAIEELTEAEPAPASTPVVAGAGVGDDAMAAFVAQATADGFRESTGAGIMTW